MNRNVRNTRARRFEFRVEGLGVQDWCAYIGFSTRLGSKDWVHRRFAEFVTCKLWENMDNIKVSFISAHLENRI